MQRGMFEERLLAAAREAVRLARRCVRQTLPDDVAFLVYPNQPEEGNSLSGDERVYPQDTLPDGKAHGPWSAAEAVTFLWRDGAVPEWIDAAVEALYRGPAYESRDDPAAGKAVQHGDLFGHAHRVVDGNDVSQDGDFRLLGDLTEYRGINID